MKLDTTSVSSPYFGPGVFDDAQRCPARASIALMGRSPARDEGAEATSVRPIVPAKMTGGGWLATMTLLKVLAREGSTALWVEGTHPITDLNALASDRIPELPAAVRDFAVDIVGGLLDAQAHTGLVLPYDPAFISRPYRGGTLHAGGVFIFAGADDTQVWRLTLGGARETEVRRNWALTAAYAVAESRSAGVKSHRIAVHEFDAANVSSSHIGTWTAEGVEREFTVQADPRLAAMAHDLTVSPGAHCASCRFVAACPAVPQSTGMLPGVSRQPQVVAVSASDLRSFSSCPARYELLTVQGLARVPVAPTAAMARGSVVGAWLTAAHSSAPHLSCTPPIEPLSADTLATHGGVAKALQVVEDWLSFEGEGIHGDAAAMLGHHTSVCPAGEADAGSQVTQRTHVILDTDTQILLVTRPDSEYKLDGDTIWRETKTRAVTRPRDALYLVQEDLTAAAYVVHLASVAGPQACLEWEELTPEAAEVTVLLLDDSVLIDQARHVLAGAVADLLRDEVRAPNPGAPCAGCGAKRWCPAARAPAQPLHTP
jgi:hypothetical protein